MAKQLLTFFAMLCSIMVWSQDVAQWRGPDRNGIYPESGLLTSWPDGGPELLWHSEGLGPGHASAAVTASGVYTAGTIDGEGYVFAFDRGGNLRWKSKYGREWVESWPGVRSTPLVIGDELYMMSGYGKLFAMQTADGSMTWQVDLLDAYDAPNIKWGVTENLLFRGDTLFATPGGAEHNIIALNRNTGKLLWSAPAKGQESAYCSPVLAQHNGRTLLITHTASSIVGLDAATGKMLWSFPWPNKYSVHANTPFYHDGRVYCMSGYGKGGVMLKIAGDGNSVEELWRNEDIDNRMGGFVVLDGYIYGSADNGMKWYGLDWNTGKPVFADNLIKKGNIIAADGMLYLYGEDGKVVLAKPDKGNIVPVSTFKVPYGEDPHWAHLVIHDGVLYVRHGDALMAYSVKAQ